jgi:hypothetical protein
MADWHLSVSGMAGVQAGIPACISKRVTTLLLFPSSVGAIHPLREFIDRAPRSGKQNLLNLARSPGRGQQNPPLVDPDRANTVTVARPRHSLTFP